MKPAYLIGLALILCTHSPAASSQTHAADLTHTQPVLGGPFTGTPGVSSAGAQLTIHYSDPTRAGQVVQVTADWILGTDTINITLDANGKGTATYTIPGAANMVELNDGQGQHHQIAIL